MSNFQANKPTYQEKMARFKPRGQLLGKKREQYKKWITFYRRNIHRFIEDYMGIKLHPYQVLMVYMLQTSSIFYGVASRATAKSFIIAVYSVAKAILYPGIKMTITAKTLSQAGIIIKDKVAMIMGTSSNIEREIERIRDSKSGYEAIFFNGSTIIAVPMSDNARGNRAQHVIIEESRLVDKDTIEKVIKPFLTLRTPPFRSLKKYANDPDYREMPTISYITSAHYADADWYQDAQAVIERMTNGDDGARFIALDHLITVKHGIKTKDVLRNEMLNNDRTTIQHEYHNIPSTISSKAFFDFSLFPRKTNKAFYPQRLSTFNVKRNPYDISKVADELRIISADIAMMSGRRNDLTILSCIRLIPGKKGYSRSLSYLESHGGVNATKQALRIKQLFFDFGADFLVIDTRNSGLNVMEELGKSITDEERNVPYPAFTLSPFNILSSEQRNDYLSRITGANGLPVMFPIVASQTLNARMYSEFKSSLQMGQWDFLVHEIDAENYLVENQPEYTSSGANSDSVAFFKNPYAQTSLFIDECVNLEATLSSGLIKLERRNGRKDRFTSVCYGNHLAEYLDREYVRETTYDNTVQEMVDLVMVY